MNNRSLNCFYDLSVSPCSYDFFAFLISAELHRVRNGFDSLKLIFVPGPEKGYRLDNLRTFEQNDNFFKNVVVNDENEDTNLQPRKTSTWTCAVLLL